MLARLTELGGGSGERAVDSGDVLVTPDVEGYPILDFTPFDDLVTEGHRAGLATLTPWWEERGRR